MMEIRRQMMGVIAQMASGAKVVKGSFTCPSSGNSYTIQFGKTFSKYLYLIEMTEASKTTLSSSGVNANQVYALLGAYPSPKINNIELSDKTGASFRINPSSQTAFNTTATVSNIGTSSIEIGIANMGASGNAVYKELSYNYTIVSLD